MSNYVFKKCSCALRRQFGHHKTLNRKSELRKCLLALLEQKLPSFAPKSGDLGFLTTEQHKNEFMGMEQ